MYLYRPGVWVCILSLFALATPCAAEDILRVHEWGTFTSFQDEKGLSFSRINTDDEPVPKFVHQLLYEGPFSPTQLPRRVEKGITRSHPEVTMRLETPVTYFHLPSTRKELVLDLSVTFHGGWLTEFFPKAVAEVDGTTITNGKTLELRETTIGGLCWKGVRLGGDALGPNTDDHVWLAPRNVRAAQVTVGNESERFLFYRGVGHRDAPLRVVRDHHKNELQIRSPSGGSSGRVKSPLAIARIWLAEITPAGTAAFRCLPAITLTNEANQTLAVTSATFTAGEFSKANMPQLRATMHAALVEQGLFDDEATAMLNTWELSYFQSPGLRLFFMLPQAWTDDVLPLNVSVPAEVTRVMVGRIELVTPRHRELLQQIAASPPTSLKEVSQTLSSRQTSASPLERKQYLALASGRDDPTNLGVPIPESYRAFLALGRFRTSLLLDDRAPKNLQKTLRPFACEVESPGQGQEVHKRDERNQLERTTNRLAAFQRQIDSVRNDEDSASHTKPVLFLGDSSIVRWDLASSFPNQATTRLAIPELQLAEISSCMRQIAISHEPRVIVLQAGELEGRQGVAAKELLSDFRAIVKEAHDRLPTTRIVILAIRPSIRYWDHFENQCELNSLLKKYCQTDQRLTFVDVVTPMLEGDGKLRPELFLKTGTDLSQQGYQIWSNQVLNILPNDDDLRP
ncbi:SGNH/GDSL hydrolase family protein [Schlesneria paludicola]|uniref:hypothetical protein n=1 Tax=Schlesneria paludicola TaxID=360056 RepID=UPI00029B1ACD|nr:hypothetical protein [Schlesneria paludicola]